MLLLLVPCLYAFWSKQCNNGDMSLTFQFLILYLALDTGYCLDEADQVDEARRVKEDLEVEQVWPRGG